MPSYFGLVHKEPDSDFGVSFPDLPGCISEGATLDEARGMAGEALALHLVGLLDEGEALPPPSPIDAIARPDDARDAVAIILIELEPTTLEVTA
jgi:predicted RNase H-like HicB family nuclease